MNYIDHAEKELDLYFKAGYQMHPAVYRYLFRMLEAISDNGLSGFVGQWISDLTDNLKFSFDIETEIQRILDLPDVIQEYALILKTINTNQLSCDQKHEVLRLFTIIFRRRLLTPLQGTDDEWIDRSEMSGEFWLQNIRDSRVFKTLRGLSFIGAFVFEDEDGSWFSNGDSQITFDGFPYMPPETQYLKYYEHNIR